MKYLFVIVLLFSGFQSRASHIVGGEIYYDYLPGDNYQFFISMYRDCNSTGAQFDNPLNLAVYTATGVLVQNVTIPFPGSQNVPVVFNNPCVIPPNNICTENALYTTILNLPPIQGGYTITYQRCCRGPNITNIINPDDVGFTLTCKIPGAETGAHVNSSPRYVNYPPQLLCNNEDLNFDHSATDPDGDIMTYSLITPHDGGTSFNPQPVPAPPPAYGYVQWANGFSAANPLGPGATISINSNTGQLLASPNLTGLFVVGIRVQEWRNGQVINQTDRDFLFRVFNCNLQLEAILPLQTELPTFVSYCDGLDVDFVNNSYGGTNYEWDFGVPGITTDVSSAFEPSYTYPDNGQYTAMLVVNPGWPCTDTAYMDVIVNNQIDVSWTSNDSLCIFGNSFDFVGSSNGPPGTSFTWDFGSAANPSNAVGDVVNGVNFNTTGQISVTLDVEFNSCENSYTDSIYIFPEPIADMILPDDVGCEGLFIDFVNNSQNSNYYEWNFGDTGSPQNTSNDPSPSYTYPGPGTYTVTLVAGSSPVCNDTITQTITLNEPLIVSFISQDSLCITDNSFDFDGTVSGPPGSVYTWNFGPNASIPTSNDIDVTGVSFNTTGAIPISLTGQFEECVETDNQTIYLFEAPTVDFILMDGLQCVPFNAQFIDLSTAETTIYYNWDFGDGSSSILQNPTHVYEQEGNYPVTLSVYTTQGCVDTLSLTQVDIVNVRPNPEAGFSVTPDYTDICNSVVEFSDESQGAYEYFYWFDDSTSYSVDIASPSHLYFNPGHHHPYQIVTNEWGCKDTANSYLYIEPFTFFAPNAFTPDGDEFNNGFNPVVYLPVNSWKLEIFNRWGERVFMSEDIDQGWDGTNGSGRICQDGIYVWKTTFVSCEPKNSERTLNGYVSLLR